VKKIDLHLLRGFRVAVAGARSPLIEAFRFRRSTIRPTAELVSSARKARTSLASWPKLAFIGGLEGPFLAAYKA